MYTAKDCGRCLIQKDVFDAAGTTYVERSADRLKGGHADYDDIDQDALVVLNQQNMKLPVIVNVQEL